MSRILFAAIFLFACLFSKGQAPFIPDEAKPFILPRYEALDYQTGDLNGDKKEDAILVLAMVGWDKVPGDRPADYDIALAIDRPFIILLRQANGKLKQALRNDSLILCVECSGLGEPYEGTKTSSNGFVVSFVGASGEWRWISEYKFVYKALQKKWVLNSEKRSTYKYNDPESTMKTVVITEAELGPVTVEKFSTSFTYDESKWKVKVAKTFFYDTPDLKSNPRKEYLVKDNLLAGMRHFTNFVEVSYDDGKGGYLHGFVLKKDLQKIQ